MPKFEKHNKFSQGRPPGARTLTTGRQRITAQYLDDLYAHYTAKASGKDVPAVTKGQVALETLWKDHPAAYIKQVSELLPKERDLNVEHRSIGSFDKAALIATLEDYQRE